MDNEKWRRILELAHAAADLPREDRSRFLRASSTEDDVVERALELADEFEAEPDSPALHPGSHIEHFIVETEIGRGGMGCVYSARDTDLERTVALKILRREAVGSTPANSLVREARAASALNHPNFCTIYEVGEDA
jgi:serine/threonine protein kinase